MTRSIIIISMLGWSCLAAEEQGRVLSEETATRIEQRGALMEDFKARLDAAKTAEEKHAVAMEMGTKLMAMRPQAADGKSAQENLAAAKTKAAGSPELLQRLEKKEALLAQVLRHRARFPPTRQGLALDIRSSRHLRPHCNENKILVTPHITV